MKHRKKGRRIYTYRTKNRRVFNRNHPMRSAFGTAVLLALLAFCVIVGYNVIGPIVTRVNLEAENPTTTPEPYFSESSDSTQETPENSSQPEQTAAQTTAKKAVTTAAVTTVVTTTTEPVMTRFPDGAEVAYLLPEGALHDLASLDHDAEAAAKQGYTSVILPLKLKGGMLQYASGNDRARTCGASSANMLTLREITNAAERYHLTCSALFSTLEDHIYPNVYMDGSFTFNGSTRWLDNKPESGGKPWLNPFDEASGNYLADLAGEIERGGFTHILCTDAVLPDFFRSDAELLGNRIQDHDQRQKALASVLNSITAAAPSAGSYLSLSELVLGNEEAFVPDLLDMKQVFVRIDPLDLPQAFTLGGQHYDPTPLAADDQLLLLAAAAQNAIGSRR
ncbi:MAG: hypothetical protein J5722_06485, partial [Oscillospiraceae bacterium]|nr:hypothetical protein [Oscillospiraceae bacterium]